jgi:hypothetical protein
MQIKTFEIPTQAIPGYEEKPSVSAIQVKKNGTLMVGTAFSRPLLLEMKFNDSDLLTKVEDLKLSQELGEDALAVLNGLKPSSTGDTAFSVLHPGSVSMFIKKIFGRNMAKKAGPELVEFLQGDDQGMGFWIRHSLIQVRNGEFTARHLREPGVLWDAIWTGDHVFGITGSSLIREPNLHLNVEKRETLRKELFSNFGIHRSEDGIIWALAQNMRLVRFVYTESKAKPTPLKLPGAQADLPESGFALSACSETDGWLYGTSGGSKILFRVRRNPVTQEEELQELHHFEDRITGLAVLDRAENSQLYWTTESTNGAMLYSMAVTKAEDPEHLPEIPPFTKVGKILDLKTVSSLTADSKRNALWVGEGRLGSVLERSEKLRILRISGI